MATRGRPSDYNETVAERICVLLSEGLSLREICRMEDMPEKSTVMRWLNKHESFRDQYARAKAAGIEVLAEDILDIADDASNDWMERLGQDGKPAGWVFNGEAAKRSQIRIDARKWLLSKMAPKKYGEKVALTGDEGGPIKSEVKAAIDVSGLTLEQLRVLASIPVK